MEDAFSASFFHDETGNRQPAQMFERRLRMKMEQYRRFHLRIYWRFLDQTEQADALAIGKPFRDAFDGDRMEHKRDTVKMDYFYGLSYESQIVSHLLRSLNKQSCQAPRNLLFPCVCAGAIPSG